MGKRGPKPKQENKHPLETATRNKTRVATSSSEAEALPGFGAADPGPSAETVSAVFSQEPNEKTTFQIEQQPDSTATPEESGDAFSYQQNYKARKKAQKQAQVTAAILLTLLDGMATSAFGGEASRNELERQLTDEPLQRWLERADPATLEVVAKYTDPILFMLGLAAWGTRIYRAEADRREIEKPYEPQRSAGMAGVPVAEAAPVQSRNGRGSLFPSAQVSSDVLGNFGSADNGEVKI